MDRPPAILAAVLIAGTIGLAIAEQSVPREVIFSPLEALREGPAGDLFWKSASGFAHTIPSVLLLLVLWQRRLVPTDRVQLSMLTFVAVAVLVGVLKVTVQRGRPFEPDSLAWPSGHSATAAALGVVFGGVSWQRTGLAGLGVFVLGASRVVLHRHWPSDVLGGFACGLGAAAFLARVPLGLPREAPRGFLAAIAWIVGGSMALRALLDPPGWHIREAWAAVMLLILVLGVTRPDHPRTTGPGEDVAGLRDARPQPGSRGSTA